MILILFSNPALRSRDYPPATAFSNPHAIRQDVLCAAYNREACVDDRRLDGTTTWPHASLSITTSLMGVPQTHMRMMSTSSALGVGHPSRCHTLLTRTCL